MRFFFQRMHKFRSATSRGMKFRRRWPIWTGLSFVVLCLFLSSNSSLAEFEVPLIDTANNLDRVELRGVWAFNRGSRSSGTTYDRYEAYAVGINPDKDINDPDCYTAVPADAVRPKHIEDCNGVFYYFNGTNWSRVPNPFLTYNNAAVPPIPALTKGTPNGAVFSLNAVSGQVNDGEGNPNPLFVAGADGRIGTIIAYYSTPGNIYTDSASYWLPSQFQLDTVNGLANPERRDFYAISAVQKYAFPTLAGGQAGLVARSGSKGKGLGVGDGAGAPPWTVFTPSFIGKTGTFANENIVSIEFSGLNTAYILTSTAPIESNAASPDYNLPRPPAAHDCTGGTQTTYLYKASAASDTAIQQWTQLASLSGSCGYALSVGSRTVDASTVGPLGNVIWIATSNGVYRYLDNGSGVTTFTGPLTNTTGKPYHAITAVRDRGGNGQSLLSNWNFESHTSTTLNADSRFDSWLYTDNTYGPGATGAVPCALNATNNAYHATTGWDGTAFGAVEIVTPPSYNTNAGCLPADFNPYYTNSVSQLVDPSTIEGQKFRLTGKYKVEFPAKGHSSWPNPVAPQGGVSLGCAGGLNNTIKYGQGGYINCSFSNRSLIRTPDNPTNTDPNRDANGWVSFDITFSREDQLFSSIYVSARSSLTQRRMFLSVVCEATYGAKVTCDDLKVEEVSTPPALARDTYTVVAAGKEVATNGIAVNTNALNSSVFRTEAMPGKFRSDALPAIDILYDINALYGLSPQHMYGVGRGHNTGYSPLANIGVVLISRTPSTLTGTIWAGGTTPTGATTSSPIGEISASCVNDRAGNLTLCQRSPDSYGLSLEITSAVTATKQGVLIGRAWFGKTPGDVSDQETLDLGPCLRAPGDLASFEPRSDPTNKPFWLGGLCDTGTGTCWTSPAKTAHSTLRCLSDSHCTQADTTLSCNPSNNRCLYDVTKSCSSDLDCNVGGVCDLVARRCWKDAAHTAYTNVSCLTNFDCFGRCADDQGFLCVRDDDCRLGPTSSTASAGAKTGSLRTVPASRLVCGQTVSGTPASPLACTPGGWLSFNSTDFTAGMLTPAGTAFTGGSFNTLFATHNSNYNVGSGVNKGAHELSGWGRFMTMAAGHCSTSATDPTDRGKTCRTNPDCSDVAGSYCVPGTGWVHLRSSAVPGLPPTGCDLTVGSPTYQKCRINTSLACTSNADCPDYLFACRNCDGGALGSNNCAFCQDASNRSCIPSSTATQADCAMECENTSDPARGGLPYRCAGVGDCTGKGGTGLCVAPGLCSGDGLTRCSDDAGCTGKGTCTFGAVCKTTGSRCVPYGIHLDTESGKFYGFAWSEDFGWLDMRNISYGGTRFIQTKLGDIYASGQIGETGLATPTSQCNATYLITAGQSITGFCSSLSATAVFGGSGVQQYAKVVPIISPENTFQSILGRFDITGIERDTGFGSNKYGSEIVPLNANDITATLGSALATKNGSLGGRVFVATPSSGTTVTLGTTQFMNTPAVDSLAVTGPGSGILIVNGNLTITGPLTYETGANVTDLRKLASLIIVVKGNVIIDNTVQDVVGAFYTTGTFQTSNGDANNQYPLVVNGLVIAKDFNFGRQYAGTVEAPSPSELIIYDGRLQSNPLPGISDFSNSLPNTGRSGP